MAPLFNRDPMRLSLALLAGALCLGGCVVLPATPPAAVAGATPEELARQQALPQGQVTRVEPLAQGGDPHSVAATVVGAAIGALVGSQVGGSDGDHTKGAVVGALGGALIGHELDQAQRDSQDRVAVWVRPDDGGPERRFELATRVAPRPGARVRIDGTRLLAL